MNVKKIFTISIYLFLLLAGVISLYILIYISSSKENDNIVRAEESNAYFRSINPKFLVDFVDSQYVRFEAVSSLENPIYGEKRNIFEKIRYILGIKQERKGIQISLLDVSYDTSISNILNIKEINPEKEPLSSKFELTEIGREIGSESQNTTSRDTIISKDIYEGVDLEYQILKGKGLKEEIVLNELPEYSTECSKGECNIPVNKFTFKIQLDEGLTINRSMTGSKQYPSGMLYITDEKGDYIAHFLGEYAVDKLGNKTSKVVSNILKVNSNEYIYEVILDAQWLLSNERVFPVRIDPSIVHDSEEIFNQGIFEGVRIDNNLTISLNELENMSGIYTSSLLNIGQEGALKDISWEGYSQATGDGEIPFSQLNINIHESFNDLYSEKVKYGNGALQLDTLENEKQLNIYMSDSKYFALEFWYYPRYVQEQEGIFNSSLLNLEIKDSKYIFIDSNGNEYITDIPVEYNRWQYIGILFDIQNSQLKIYIDQYEKILDITYLSSTLSILSLLQGNGYIDELRVYDRLVTKNEFLSNSQYSNIFLQYSFSEDGLNWKEWSTKSKYTLPYQVKEGNIFSEGSTQDLSQYEILNFKYISEKEEKITLGSNMFVNGFPDQNTLLLEGEQGAVEPMEALKYLDLVFTPNSKQNACILSLGGLEIYSSDTGKVQINIGGELIESNDMYLTGNKNILSLSLSDLNTSIYLNGNMYSIEKGYTLNIENFVKGSGCSKSENSFFEGEVNQVRISNTEISKDDIEEYMGIYEREYILKPVFRAKLQKDGEILNESSISFSLLQEGSTQMVSNLNMGDTVYVKEGEYIAQGEVLSVENDTGYVILKSWYEGSTYPQSGFTTNALVLKWENKYIFTSSFLNTKRSNMNIYISGDIVENIKDITVLNAYDSKDDILFESSNDIYMKYKFIFMTSRFGISPNLRSVNMEFVDTGPDMQNIMRHGKWFNEGTQQKYWWVNI